MRRYWLILCAICLAAAPAGPAVAKLRVVTTLSDLARIAEAVGGQDVEVEALCPGGRDPHFLPAKPSLARRLARADLLCYNGLELEIGWLPQLIDKARNPRVRPGQPGDLDCSRALEHILEVPQGTVDRGQGDVHPLGNPHYTVDPRNAVLVGRLMAGRLAELDPVHAADYGARAESFAAEVARRLPAWRARTEPVRRLPLIIYHRNWSYLVDWLGLNVVGEIEHRPGISPSPRHVEELIQAARTRDATGVIAATWDHLDVAREVARRLDAPLAVLPGYSGATDGTEDYFAFIDRLCAGLAGLVTGGQGVQP